MYHAGDGKGDGNLNSIAVEICVNSDGNFNKALANAAELVKQIMNDENIPKSHIKQHHHWSGENCPGKIRENGEWDEFLQMVDDKKVESAPDREEEAQTVSSGSGGQEIVTLPASSNSWRSYPVDAASTKGNEKGFLRPSKFGGLQYDVLGHPQKNVVTINTDNFGKGNIYVAPDTGATISNGSSNQSDNSGGDSGKAGQLKIVGVNNAAIVMDKPNRNNSSNLGTVSKGDTLPLNGSVRGTGSDTGYYEVKYKGQLGYITGQYGKQV
ncbi:hypothetical protein GCM10028778_08050 [Barrientosiimonas marina]